MTVIADSLGYWSATLPAFQSEHYVQPYSPQGNLWGDKKNIPVDQTTLETKNLILHVGDTWDLGDNIAGYTDENGGHHDWVDFKHSQIRVGMNASASDNVNGIWNGSTKQLIKPGTFTVTYTLYTTPAIVLTATITVLP